MSFPLKVVNYSIYKSKQVFLPLLLSFPQKVECNVCGWRGSGFLSDLWHKHILCTLCGCGVRHRLFFAALQNLDDFSFGCVLENRKILHFAPDEPLREKLRGKSSAYTTADYFREGFDLKLDMSAMPEIENESFDVVIAFDVLEHVPDYQKALAEVRRILTPKGLGIFTVPQKDNLLETLEDENINTPEDRLKHYGQDDHLRFFGDDFAANVEKTGFLVTAIDETSFPEEMRQKNVLFPPQLSDNPLATNYRKVFFCRKTA